MSGLSQKTIKKNILVNVDLVCLSGGWNPTVNLFSQSGGKLKWDNTFSFFKPDIHVQDEVTVGGSNGNFDLENSISETILLTNKIVKKFNHIYIDNVY